MHLIILSSRIGLSLIWSDVCASTKTALESSLGGGESSSAG